LKDEPIYLAMKMAEMIVFQDWICQQRNLELNEGESVYLSAWEDWTIDEMVTIRGKILGDRHV
jgi:hypothetical protein